MSESRGEGQSSSRGVRETADTILSALHNAVPFERATLQIIEGTNRRLVSKYNLDDSQIQPYLLRPLTEDKLVREIIEKKAVCYLRAPTEHPYWEALTTTSDIKAWIGIPLSYYGEVIALITIDQLEETANTEDQQLFLELFSSHASTVLKNAMMNDESVDRVRELTQTKDFLEVLNGYLEDWKNLAMIGLIYGESIHWANANLGMAKTMVKNMKEGRYGLVSDPLKARLNEIVQKIDHYLGKLDDFKQRALKSPGLSSINLYETIKKVLDSKRADEICQVSYVYDKSVDPYILAPDLQLRQVFLVIIQNAMEALAGRQGVIEFRSQRLIKDGILMTRISISDNGVGIPIEEQKDIFELKPKYESAKRKKGSGMGLPWARGFLREYGGDITFETIPSKGTTFHVIIPKDFSNPFELPTFSLGAP